MKKILVADDSVTIQKVISITLAGLPFTLKSAYSEGELHTRLEEEHFDLVLLDYSLSLKKSGNDFVRELVLKYPKIPILLMPGVFDQVDDTLLESIGLKYSIVKPFESSRFIKLCTEILEEQEMLSSKETSHFAQEKDLEARDARNIVGDTDNSDQGLKSGEGKDSSEDFSWVMSGQDLPDEIAEQEGLYSKGSENMKDEGGTEKNVLESEIDDWITEIPKIHESQVDADELELPPTISMTDLISPSLASHEEQALEFKHSSDSENAVEEIMALVDNRSADVQDDHKIREEQERKENEERAKKEVKKESDSSLVLPPEEDLVYPDVFSAQDEGIDLTAKIVSFDDMAMESFAIQRNNGELTEKIQLPQDLSSSLESAIADGNEEEDDIWKIDDNQEQSISILEESSKGHVQIDEDVLVEKIKASLLPALEDLVKNYCQNSVEKVAWEVIPDLAENIIRKEISLLKDDVEESEEE